MVNDSNSLQGLGAPRTFGKNQEMVFLGRDIGTEEKDYGNQLGEEIDRAVTGLLNAAYNQAVEVIKTHQPKLVRLAEYLIEHEKVSGEAMNRLFNADDETGDEPAEPVTPPETPPSFAPAKPKARARRKPAAPQTAPTLSSTSNDSES